METFQICAKEERRVNQTTRKGRCGCGADSEAISQAGNVVGGVSGAHVGRIKVELNIGGS